MEPHKTKPAYVTELEQAFGGPSQNAFGSAVFLEPNMEPDQLEAQALATYQHFCGDTWARFGEQNWLANWKLVYARNSGSTGRIVDELGALEDRNAKSSAEMLLDNVESQAAMRTSFDDVEVSQLCVFKIGDGGAMSGLLIAAVRPEGTVLVVFLMD